MRSKNLLVLTLISLVVLSTFVSAIAGFAQVKIKVFDSETENEIKDAIVTFKKLNFGTDEEVAPYTDGAYTNSKWYADDQKLLVTVSRESYADYEEEITLNTDEYEEFTTDIFITASSGEFYLISEELSTSDCDSDYAETNQFEDGTGTTIHHCVKSEIFTTNNFYLIDSYIQQDTGAEPVCDRGDDYDKSGQEFEDKDSNIYYLCIKTEQVSDPSDEQILKTSAIEFGGSCNSGDQSGDSIQVTDEDEISHCISGENLELGDVFDCTLDDAFWGDEQKNRISEYTIGSQEDLYLFVDWEDCENEEIEFTITQDGNNEIDTYPQESTDQGVEWSWYIWDGGPRWPQEVPGLQNLESIEFDFTAKVKDKNIELDSNVLKVFPPEDPCESNDDCEEGLVCKEGACITPEGDCTLTNPRWLKEADNSAGFYPDDAEVVGWEEGKENGTIVYPSAEVTDSCNEFTIGFQIYREVWGEDAQVGSTLEGSYADGKIIAQWFPEWVNEIPWLGINNPKYYFIAITEEDENIKSSESSVIIVTRPGEAGLDASLAACELANPRWYNAEGNEISAPVKGWTNDADLQRDELSVFMVVDKIENSEGSCGELSPRFNVYELQGGTIFGQDRNRESENTPRLLNFETLREEDIVNAEETLGISRDEVFVAQWIPRQFTDSEDSVDQNPRYQFEVVAGDLKSSFSETLKVDAGAEETGISGGSEGIDIIGWIGDVISWIGGIFGG